MMAAGAAARAYKKHGPINYRAAAKKIQAAYRKYKKTKTTGTKKRPFKDAARPKAGRFPNARIGRQMGVYGKPGKLPAQLGTVRRTLDKSLTSTQQDVNYVGFQCFGSTKEILETFSAQVWKDIFQRAGSPLSSWQGRVRSDAHVTPAYSNRLASVTFYFQRDSVGDVARTTWQYTFATTDTTNSLIDDLTSQIFSQYNNGYLPRAYSLEDASGTPFVTHETWGEDVVTWNAEAQIKVQNVTPSVGGSTDINDVNANPLQGKVYDFRNSYAKFVPDYLQMIEATNVITWGGLKDFQDMGYADDLLRTEKLRHSGLYANELVDALQSPPRGPAVFQNLEGVKNVQLPPGGFQVVKRSIKSTCTVTRFIWGVFNVYLPDDNSSYVKPNMVKPIVNKVIMMGLEPTVRSVTDELVKVIVNRKIQHSISIKKKRPSNLPVKVDVSDAVTIGQ